MDAHKEIMDEYGNIKIPFDAECVIKIDETTNRLHTITFVHPLDSTLLIVESKCNGKKCQQFIPNTWHS